MNELDLLRSFRADESAPSAAATARAERAWRGQRARPPRGMLRAAIAGGLIAVTSAVALILPAERGGEIGTQDARAAETLRRAAAAQHTGLNRPLRPGEYWYVRRRNVSPSEFVGRRTQYTIIQPELREDWIGADGSRRWSIRPVGRPRFPRTVDRARWEAAGSPPGTTPDDERLPASENFYVGEEAMAYRELLALPRDPEALYGRLRSAAEECTCGNSIDEETFVIAGDLLRDSPIPADLRSAVLRAAALIPGIEFVDDARDVAGRTGVGVAIAGATGPVMLVFDPSTYQLLGQTEDGGGSADLGSAIVGSPGQRP